MARAKPIFFRPLRLALLLGGALLLILLAIYGPTLLDLYRLDRAITQDSVARAADAGPWPAQTDACVPCHGRNGHSVNDQYPQLAGLPEAYVAAQLRAFASGERDNPNMSSLALALSDAERDALARHFAAQRPRPVGGAAPDAQQRDRGAALAARLACASCHGADFGGQAQMPRLAGQGAPYLARQLRDFQRNRRRDPSGAMNALAAPLSAADIDDLASFLAAHEVKPQ